MVRCLAGGQQEVAVMVVKAWNRSGGMKANLFLFVHWGGSG